jgi:hypothetical protein
MPATATSVVALRTLADGTAKPPFTITAVAWIVEGDLDLAEWSRQGQRLSVMNRCSPWWLGDWIRYGDAKFGEKYSRAAKITRYDAQTLMNMVYVASHFEISRRRENLSWSHHETVASLDPSEQDRWLDEAVEHKMSVADLRLQLRSRHRSHKDASGPESASGAQEGQEVSITCPNCAQPIPRSLLTAQLRTHPHQAKTSSTSSTGTTKSDDKT